MVHIPIIDCEGDKEDKKITCSCSRLKYLYGSSLVAIA